MIYPRCNAALVYTLFRLETSPQVQDPKLEGQEKLMSGEILNRLRALQLRMERIRIKLSVITSLMAQVPIQSPFIELKYAEVVEELCRSTIYVDFKKSPKDYKGDNRYTPLSTVWFEIGSKYKSYKISTMS